MFQSIKQIRLGQNYVCICLTIVFLLRIVFVFELNWWTSCRCLRKTSFSLINEIERTSIRKTFFTKEKNYALCLKFAKLISFLFDSNLKIQWSDCWIHLHSRQKYLLVKGTCKLHRKWQKNKHLRHWKRYGLLIFKVECIHNSLWYKTNFRW